MLQIYEIFRYNDSQFRKIDSQNAFCESIFNISSKLYEFYYTNSIIHVGYGTLWIVTAELYHIGYNFKIKRKIYTRFGIFYRNNAYLCTR